MTFTKHQAGELDCQGMQKCILCGGIITDSSQYGLQEGPPLPGVGFPPGPVWISHTKNPTITTTMDPADDGDTVINCCGHN